MKKRAPLLRFAASLAGVVSIGILGLSIAGHNQAKYAPLGAGPSHASKASAEQIRAQYGRLPLSFRANLGQTAPEVQFLSQGAGYELFLTRQDAVLALQSGGLVRAPRTNRAPYTKALLDARRTRKTSLLRLHFDGANSAAEVRGVDRLPGRTDYFIGNDPKNWRTEVPSYSRVAYQGIYSGVDAVFYGNQRQLEYDFVVAPGADPKQIALDVEGAKTLKLDAKGNLVMGVSGGQVRLLKPMVYQQTNGERREIAGNYEITREHRVTFSIGNYDRNERLVIDPVLDYSTYLGGGPDNALLGLTDAAYGIAVDSSGDAYVTGQTFSVSFPTKNGYTPGPLGAGNNPNGAVFVTELNPTGTGEVYSTYLIGTDTEGDYGYAIALDPGGKIYVAGRTYSTQFPTTALTAAEPAPTDPGTVVNVGTAFLSKIDPTLSGSPSLVYSSYLGGSGGATLGDFATGVAADASGNAYVGGITASSDFLTAQTTATGYQTSNADTTNGVAFLVKVNTLGSGASSVLYSTYLGGNGTNAPVANQYGDLATGVAADSSGNAYVVGETTSTNFPTLNGLQSGPNAANTNGEAFVSQINTTVAGAGSLVYSTYLGGNVFDVGDAIALKPGNATPANAVYVTGFTASHTTSPPTFPTTAGAYVAATGAADVVFVTELNMTPPGGLGSLKYSALVGGTGGDDGNGIAVDSSGNAYVAGGTSSADFPVIPLVGAFQTSDTNTGGGTAFLFELNPGGNGAADLVYSTYFGGSGPGPDTAWAIALDSGNNPYITGQTASTSNFPIYPSTAFQTTLTQFDATATTAGFVAKLTLEPTIIFSATTLAFGNEAEGSTAVNCGALAPCVVTLTNNTGVAIPIAIQALTGTNPGDFAAGGAGTTCVGSVPAGGNCTIAVTFTPSLVPPGPETATLPIQYTAGNSAAATQNITLTGTGTAVANFTLLPAVLPAFPATLITTTSTTVQQVTLTNTSLAAEVFTITASTNFGETDNCGGANGLPGGAMCTINVSFTPTATGSLNGALTAASGGAMLQTALSGTGGDFSLTSVPASVTVTNNAGNFMATLTTTPQGFAPTVTYTCTTTIPKGSCTAVVAGQAVTVNISVASALPPSGHRLDGQRL
ncbi:MAG TPA: SBBP repeat-containing protein, partial [Candidatus Acidoferrales bacterium]|nr:SBBP repeat-containing protein [Candidatus Acidoferrales bacterium]